MLSEKNILIGFDGFIDTIGRIVDFYDKNHRKVYIDSIKQFGQKIIEASGKSTNLEFDIICKKIGGNGPILSEALRVLGAHTTYIGTLGNCSENVFCDFARNNNAISIGLPGETRAVEFNDGKILLGEMYDVVNINSDILLQVCGENLLRDIVLKSQLICFVNWTMLVKLNTIFDIFLNKILGQENHIFFFDLADPTKRLMDDVRELIMYFQKFSQKGDVILGLNLMEASRLLNVLGYQEKLEEVKDSMLRAVQFLYNNLNCSALFIHANTMSVGCNGKTVYVSGYFSSIPKISTGAGDHFNAGFLCNYLESRDIELALHWGSAVAKYYVDNAYSPTCEQVRLIGCKK